MRVTLEGLRRRLVHRTLIALARPRFRFRGCRIVVPPGVLNPTAFRASLTFARAAERAAPAAPSDVLELGCGAGLAAVLLARHGHRVTATDIEPRAASAAAANARRNRAGLRALACDWDAALTSEVRFDLVVVNPPFLVVETPVLRRALYGGARLEAVAAALAAVGRRLRPAGRALLLTSERSGRGLVLSLLAQTDLEAVEGRTFTSWGELYHVDLLSRRHPAAIAEGTA